MKGFAGLQARGVAGPHVGGGCKKRNQWGPLHAKAGPGRRRSSGPPHHGPRKRLGAEINSSSWPTSNNENNYYKDHNKS